MGTDCHWGQADRMQAGQYNAPCDNASLIMSRHYIVKPSDNIANGCSNANPLPSSSLESQGAPVLQDDFGLAMAGRASSLLCNTIITVVVAQKKRGTEEVPPMHPVALMPAVPHFQTYSTVNGLLTERP